MYSKNGMNGFTGDCWAQLERLGRELREAEAILVGAGAGMSAAAGLTYSGERFQRYFSDFRDAYGITDMYAGGFYPYGSLEEYWAWWSRHILLNRYESPPGAPYRDLLSLVRGKEYFVLTTNVDHQFQLAGFEKKRLFYTQGDYGLWQCSKPCHDRTYDNEEPVRQMAARQKNLRIPAELIPRCPVCGASMTMNLRCDDRFVEDEGWFAANRRYGDFLRRIAGRRVLYLELGVGGNTPGIIKYPFWRMTAQNPKAVYACVNLGKAFCPEALRGRSLCLNTDLGETLSVLRRMR